MTKEEIIKMACQAFGGVIKKEERDNFINFAKLVAEHEREEIKQEFWLCLQSDLENGVKSLNEKAYKNFAQTMPELNKFNWLKSRGQE